MSLTKIGSIGINTGIQLAGVTTVAEFHVGTGSSVGIGTIAPDTPLHIRKNDTGKYITLSGANAPRNNYFGLKDADNLEIAADEDDEGPSSSIRFRIDGSEVARIHSAGRLGIGTDNPLAELHLVADNPNIEFNDVNTLSNGEITLDNTQLRIECDEDNAVDSSAIAFRVDGSDYVTIGSDGNLNIISGELVIPDVIRHRNDANTKIRFPDDDTITAETGGSERVRINSGGKILVGHTTARGIGGSQFRQLQIEGTSAGDSGISMVRNSADASPPSLNLGKSRASSVGGTTIVQDGDALGNITFSGADGTDLQTNAAVIRAEVDGTPGANDMPGRLIFKTTADGAEQATERLRITKSGRLLIGDNTDRGFDGGNTPLVQVADNVSGRWARIASTTYINSTIGGGIILAHSRNATVGSHTIVQDDDKLGSVFFEGSDGSAFQRGAQIQAYVDGTPGSDDMPGRIEFATTADGSSSPTTNLVIDSSGRLIAAAGRSTARTNYKDINGDSSTPSFQFETANDDSAHSLSLTYGRNNTHGPELKLAKHRTATIGGNTIVQSGDELGCINFLGSDGTNFLPAASIRGTANLAPGSNSMPGALRFGTTGNNAGITTDHWQINRSGILDQLHSGAMIRFLHGHTVTANDATVLNNTLDDYEEGTLDWEIHKSGALTTGSNNVVTRVNYQKIGGFVSINGFIRTDSNAGNATTIILTDGSGNRAQLPFTPTGSGAFTVTQTRAFAASNDGQFMITWAGGNDDVYVHQSQANVYIPNTDNCTSTTQTNLVIAFHGQYFTTD